MQKAKYKSGDIVGLKTGDGPKMTVNKISGDRVECVWFTPRPNLPALSSAITAQYPVQWDGPQYADFHEDALVDASGKPVVVEESTVQP